MEDAGEKRMTMLYCDGCLEVVGEEAVLAILYCHGSATDAKIRR